jgi:hypothetical protein
MERVYVTHYIRSWVGPRAGLKAFEKIYNSLTFNSLTNIILVPVGKEIIHEMPRPYVSWKSQSKHSHFGEF